MALPTGVSESDWSAALQALTNVVGSEWVFTEEEHTSLYHDVYSIYQGEPEDPIVPAAVATYTAEEVQQCVRIANQFKIPDLPDIDRQEPGLRRFRAGVFRQCRARPQAHESAFSTSMSRRRPCWWSRA